MKGVEYQKLYAYLVGQIDDALQMIANGYGREDYGKDQLIIDVGCKLKDALMQAEEMYVDMEEHGETGK